MTGYQEILTDPSYAGQMVTLTCPHIGNTGVNDDDRESDRVFAEALIIRAKPYVTSNFRSESALFEYLEQNNTVAITDIDTRALTRHIRNHGAQAGCIVTGTGKDTEQIALQQARAFAGLAGQDLASQVTTSQSYEWTQGLWQAGENPPSPLKEHDSIKVRHVVAYDFQWSGRSGTLRLCNQGDW